MDRKPRKCAVCSASHATDEPFAYVCDCYLWQGVCTACVEKIPAAGRQAFAREKLGKDHSVKERLPGDGPPRFESLFRRSIIAGDVPGVPPEMRKMIAALPPDFQGIAGTTSKPHDVSPLMPWPWPIVAPLIAFLAILLWQYL